ncbi:hypothetical protein RO575_17585 [Methylomonas sp. MO1]|uniref:hypothetical protein n=1 Tax=unclassified Methylomonas TaxID=2608980 RepID=UPI000479C6EB|nr:MULTISPECIES: hypothetical protein [unclassified Methylomonas]MDT4291381.1 hypothetical protein [Methylomonas sp. MO1]
MEHIFPLPRPTPTQAKPSNPVLHAGHRYSIDTQKLADNRLGDVEHDLQNGLLGDYLLSIERAEVMPVETKQTPTQAFVWNNDLRSPPLISCLALTSADPQLPNQNRLTLLDIGMPAPTVSLADDMPTLSIAPHFELEWDTAGFCSQLGVLQLVESSRTAHFADGETMTLVDTETEEGGPVLYLSGKARPLPVTPLGPFQQQGQQQKLLFSQAVAQAIPSEIAGNAVASISVLEKYTVYFMQNAGPDRPDLYIWVPVHLPIVWGWSIRVQQRYDGVWDIFRKKLIMPSASTEAPRLPLWQSNSLLCQTTQTA